MNPEQNDSTRRFVMSAGRGESTWKLYERVPSRTWAEEAKYMSELPIIEYFGFHDIPREIIVSYRSELYLLDNPFDVDTDDYSKTFTIYALTADAYNQFRQTAISFNELITHGSRVGEIPLADVRFDETRRRSIGDEIFDRITPSP